MNLQVFWTNPEGLWEKSESRENHPSGAKAPFILLGLSGTAKAVPFQNRSEARVFPLPEESCSFKTGLSPQAAESAPGSSTLDAKVDPDNEDLSLES